MPGIPSNTFSFSALLVRRIWVPFRSVCILFVLLSGCGSTPGSTHDADFSVLFIGNSLTYVNDLPSMLERLLAHSDLGEVEVASIAHPNYGLEDHWFSAEARARIADGWDVVVLQQGPSATEGRPSLLEYSQKFAEEIRLAGAIPAMYMVWPADIRRSDMWGVSDSYTTAAELIDGYIFPAGAAWSLVWERDPSLLLYGSDHFHPSLAGTFLAALVMYGQLSGRDPLTLPSSAAPKGISGAILTVLETAASDANELYARIPDSNE